MFLLVFFKPKQKTAYLKALLKNSVSQIFLDTIQNRVPSRPAQIEAAYIEALLYHCIFVVFLF